MSSVESNPPFSAMIVGSCLNALAYDWIAMAYLPLTVWAKALHAAAICISLFPPP